MGGPRLDVRRVFETSGREDFYRDFCGDCTDTVGNHRILLDLTGVYRGFFVFCEI